jgi:hypothetical protein
LKELPPLPEGADPEDYEWVEDSDDVETQEEPDR